MPNQSATTDDVRAELAKIDQALHGLITGGNTMGHRWNDQQSWTLIRRVVAAQSAILGLVEPAALVGAVQAEGRRRRIGLGA